ncbi:hypothetical protein [Flagellimonas onchidii]|uniref:hypothetical protein n=1 Tax=Flagellimonas onchidii TaxID=2562684 RepID=UPI0010A5AC46|nr:hypothetical protein [Allomuricauda onchidii]
MRLGIIIFLLCVLTQSCIATKYDCVDKKACREIENRLDLIIRFNLYFQSSNGEIQEVGIYLSNLTGIETEADVQYEGLLPPTLNDLEKWSAWYNLNHNMLRYDRKSDSVYVIK